MKMKNLKVISILVLSILTLFASCTKKPCGSGSLITKEISMSSFNSIKNKTVSQTTISEGATPKIEVTGYSYIIEDNLSLSVSNQTLTLDYLNTHDYCPSDYDNSLFDITIPHISNIELTGTGNLIVNDFHNQGDLSFLNTGTGAISTKQLTGTKNLTVTIKGTGNIIANNNIDSLKNTAVLITGTGSFKAFPLQTESCTVTVTGTGSCEIFAKTNLVVNIKGSGNVYYKGTPSISQNITGSGKLINAN